MSGSQPMVAPMHPLDPLTRTEIETAIDVVRCQKELRPDGIFDRNPTLDVSPPAAHCES
jgi:Cu2+-containing amine oxidase